MRRLPALLRFLSALVLCAGSVTAVIAWSAAPAAAASTSAYTAVSPTRILDTRTTHAVAPHGVVTLAVTGHASVPAGATAVAMTVTVTQPTAGGFITAYPADAATRPTASNLNFGRGQTIPNLVVVTLSGAGTVDLYNGSPTGTVQLIADVSGYFSGTPANSQGTFGAGGPVRRLDTRVSGGAVGPNGTVSFVVTGTVNGFTVPADASAVVVNLTATGTTAGGNAAAYPAGGSTPTSSNLNFGRGQTVADLVVVPVGSGGRITIANNSPGSTQYIADVSGYFVAGDPVSAGGFGALSPARIFDSRNSSAVPANGTITVRVTGRAGVPLSAVRAVVLTVTATQVKAGGFVSVYASGDPSPPTVSNLNFGAGQTVPDAVIAPVGADGSVAVHNGSPGTVQILVDVSGYLRNTDAPLPGTVSISRYVRNLTTAYAGHPADNAATMDPEGCADAQAGSSLVLLDIGAQSQHTPLSSVDPGVVLTTTEIRLDYAQLVAALQGYVGGFVRCGGGAGTSIAVATNSDGDFAAYTATQKGTDWADQVIDPLVSYAAGRVHIVAANDIEVGFAGTEQNAEDWETAYLAATSANLLDVGSADGCPTAYGTVTTSCAAVRDNTGALKTWTQAQYHKLAGGVSPSRVSVLPQIYYRSQAVQWANISASGTAPLAFAGSLTEHGANCGADCAMTPPQGWATLYHALSTVIGSPSLPSMTDLLVG